MKEKIRVISSEQDILEEVINLLGDNIDKSNYTVIFPTKRAGVYIKKKLADKLQNPFFPPETTTINSWITQKREEILGFRKTINNLDELYLLFQLLQDEKILQKTFNDFEQSYFWLNEILSAINELFKNGMESADFKNIFSDNKDIENEIWDNLPTIYDLLINKYENEKLTNSSYDYYLLAKNLDKIKDENIIIAGLYALNNVEKEIILQLLKNNNKLILISTENDDIIIKKLLEKFKKVVKKEEISILPVSKTEQKRFFYTTPSEEGQTHIIREIISKKITKKEPQWNDTLIALPREEFVIPLLHETLSKTDILYNISMGVPLNRTIIYSLTEKILNIKYETKDNLIYFSEYFDIIFNPYIKNLKLTDNSNSEIFTRIYFQTFKEYIEEQKLTFFNLDEINNSEKFKNLITDKLSKITKLTGKQITQFLNEITNLNKLILQFSNNEKTTIKEIIENLKEIILIIAEKSLFNNYLFYREHLNTIFDTFEELLSSSVSQNIKFSLKGIIKIIKSEFDSVTIPFSGSPVTGLQILGMLETRGLKFDRIILVDMNEDHYPPKPSNSSLLPAQIMKLLGLTYNLNYYQLHDLIVKHNLYTLTQGAKEVHFIYTENKKTIPNRFVQELIWEEEKKKGELDKYNSTTLKLSYEISPEQTANREIKKTDKIISELERSYFSYSKLSTYIECPYKFYFNYVLKLSEADNMEEGLDYAEIGSIIHDILKESYEKMFLAKKKLISPDNYKTLMKIIEKETEKQLELIYPEQNGKKNYNSIILGKIIKNKLGIFITKDLKKNQGKKISTLETAFNTTIELGNNKNISLTGRFDRIQEDENTIEIIDYKTGKNNGISITGNEISNIENSTEGDKILRKFINNEVFPIQIPLYMLAYDKEFSSNKELTGSLYYIKDKKNIFEEFPEDISAKIFLTEFENNILKPLLNNILNKEIPFYSDPIEEKTCEYCPYSTICQKGLL